MEVKTNIGNALRQALYIPWLNRGVSVQYRVRQTLLVSEPQVIRDASLMANAAKCEAACVTLFQGAVSLAVTGLQATLRLLAKR